MAITNVEVVAREITSDGLVRVVVNVTDDTLPGVHTYDVRLPAGPDLMDRVKTQVRERHQAKLAATAVPTGTIDVTAPAIPPVDPAVTARDAWLRDYKRLRALKQLIADGLTETAAITTAKNNLTTAVNTGFLPGYVDFV